MKIYCKYDALVYPKCLAPNQRNRNKHPKSQIEQLAKIIEHEGWRDAIIVSNYTSQIVAGHGRVQAALLKQWEAVPVIYQDFDNLDAEYRFMVAHNAIARQSHLDLSTIHADFLDIGPFDVDLLGIRDFQFEPNPTVPYETCDKCGSKINVPKCTETK